MYWEKPKSIGSVLKSLINDLGMREKIEETRAIEMWATIAGEQINGVTQAVWMNKGRLFVKISVATWRQELHLRRNDWRNKLNKALGKETVVEIIFR